MRKTILFIAILIFIMPVCFAREYALNTGSEAYLIDENGSKIAEGYAEILSLKDGLYIARKSDSQYFRVYSVSGDAPTREEFISVKTVGDYYICRKSDGYRIYDEDFNALTGAYEQLEAFGDAFLGIHTNVLDEIYDEVLYIDKNGDESPTAMYVVDGLSVTSEGLMALCDADTRLYGYAGADGHWIIEPAFTYAGEFHNGFAIASTVDGYGIINAGGMWVAQPRYSYAARNDENIVLIYSGTAEIYRNGNLIFKLYVKNAPFYLTENCLVLLADYGTSVYRTDGELLFTLPEGASVESAGEVFIARYDNGCLLADSEGRHITVKFENIYYLGNELFACGDSQYAIFNANGARTCESTFIRAALVNENLLFVQDESGASVITPNGETVTKLD